MTALYRKYRPQHFEEIVGQNPIRVTLLEGLKLGRLSHAYLFSGPRGTGKTSTARLLARAIQCEKLLPTGEPCSQCEICQLNAKGELVDLVEVDAASNRGIDEIRDLREKIRFAPTRAKAKVYIIDEVHMLTKEAFNALLKSLEEPPSHVFFILATTEIHKIPETILSRCQCYEFKRISEREMLAQLEKIAKAEGREAEPSALELIVKYADGGMRDAISLFEQLSSEALTVQVVQDRLGLANHQMADELYAALGSADPQKGLELIEQLHKDGYDLQQFTVTFLGLLREKIHEAVALKKNLVLPKLIDWATLFDEAWVKLKRASIATLPLEIAVIRATQNTQGLPTENPVHASSPAHAPSPIKASNAPTPTSSQEGLKREALLQQLPKVYSAISQPGVRVSFQTGRLKSIEGQRLSFSFGSEFHLSKVNDPESRVAIEEALKKVLSEDVKLFFELEKPAEDPLGWETVEEPLHP